jgi:hypothetical protein
MDIVKMVKSTENQIYEHQEVESQEMQAIRSAYMEIALASNEHEGENVFPLLSEDMKQVIPPQSVTEGLSLVKRHVTRLKLLGRVIYILLSGAAGVILSTIGVLLTIFAMAGYFVFHTTCCVALAFSTVVAAVAHAIASCTREQCNQRPPPSLVEWMHPLMSAVEAGDRRYSAYTFGIAAMLINAGYRLMITGRLPETSTQTELPQVQQLQQPIPFYPVFHHGPRAA